MSKLNKKIREKFENFFDWIKGAELVELETCNTKEDPIRPGVFVEVLLKGSAIENAIEDILRNKKYLNSTKALTFEPTSTNAKYVIPSLKPYAAINYLSTQSLSGKYNNAGYLFYENSQGRMNS